MNSQLKSAVKPLQTAKKEIQKVIVGMENAVDLMLVALGANGHVRFEGPPGLAKTLLVSTTAEVSQVEFRRLQMTPDLIPRDILWLSDFDEDGKIVNLPGPVFTNFFLADEINRAGPKVHSALLEVMEERQVSSLKSTEPLPKPFIVFATTNPIDYEGTYPLLAPQEDRFMMYIEVGYPSDEESMEIATQSSQRPDLEAVITGDEIIQLQQLIEKEVKVDKAFVEKAVKVVSLTRPETSDVAKDRFKLGASPRALKDFVRGARVLAVMNDRDYVVPEDIISLHRPILEHRLMHEDGVLPDDYKENFTTTMEEIIDIVFTEGEQGAAQRL